MKTILFLILISFLFIGCEKERCFTCVTDVSDKYGSQNYQKTSIICGTMSIEDAERQAGRVPVSGSGITVIVTCTK